MDFITGLLSSKVGINIYNLILVIVDRYIKMTQYLFCIKIITASKLVNFFFNQVITRFNIFSEIINNYNTIFINEF